MINRSSILRLNLTWQTAFRMKWANKLT